MPKLITKEKKRECIRLRIDENLSTPKIARAVGLCNYSVYRILKNYPWRKERRAATHGKTWTHDDDMTLANMWPVAEPEEIMKALPGRSWYSISKRANQLGARRRPPSSRRSVRAVHPLLQRLRTIRENQKLTRPQLAAKLGYHPNQLLVWENGKARPMFQHVEDWVAALGYALVLQPKSEAEIIAFPDRKRLMAGR